MVSEDMSLLVRCAENLQNGRFNRVFSLHFSGHVSVNGKPELYVFNAFFMNMRSKFVGEGKSIHCYVVEWEPSKLSWAAFRNEILG